VEGHSTAADGGNAPAAERWPNMRIRKDYDCLDSGTGRHKCQDTLGQALGGRGRMMGMASSTRRGAHDKSASTAYNSVGRPWQSLLGHAEDGEKGANSLVSWDHEKCLLRRVALGFQVSRLCPSFPDRLPKTFNSTLCVTRSRPGQRYRTSRVIDTTTNEGII
jgi:hypothetical protein